MKAKNNIKTLFVLSSFLLTGVILLNNINSTYIDVNAASNSPTYQSSLTKNINLNKNSDSEIRNYYSSLNNLNEAERKGQNLLKNLKPILQHMNYFSYTNVWKIYEITDREWELSPASETTYGTYDNDSNTISNYEYGSSNSPKNDPYVKTLYRNKDENGVTIQEARIKEWGSHTSDGTNREHIWCQSRGFKKPSEAEGPAGTDLHHLRSGDGYVNQSLHNDNPYGYVDKSKSYTDGKTKQPWLEGNLKGKPLNTSKLDEGDVVFEPQDSDKGDIARAVFYMAACYNNISGNETITKYNPNLTIIDYVYNAKAAVESSADKPVSMSKLSDLLEWHKLDPVDEFEIYRNDLIYNNYQHNRNPFIDFPDWVDVVWGNENKVASPNKDKIHGASFSISSSNIVIDITKQTTFTLTAFSSNNAPITWTISNPEIVSADKLTSLPDEEVTFKILNVGECTISATSIVDGEEITQTCKVLIEKGFVLEPWMLIALGVVGFIILIIFIIILSASSNARKAVKKNIKTALKKASKSKKSKKTKK